MAYCSAELYRYTFDYNEFADVLFGLFEVDPKWTQVTLAWWNQWAVVNSGDVKLTKFIYSQVFGNWNGGASRSTRQSGDDVLAKAKAQIARRAKEEAAADRAAAAKAEADDEMGDGESTAVVQGL